jgi:SNF2 family DNA or RNA helicase
MKIPLPTHRRELLSVDVPGSVPMLDEILRGRIAPSGAQLTLLNKQRQHLSLKKAQALDLKQFLSRHARVVFWIWFKETAQILENRLKEEFFRVPVDVITGEAPTKRRSSILAEWGNPASVGIPRVLIASVAAASMGISLNNAEAAVFIDLDWTPLNLLQAEKRHHRFGSFMPELVSYYMVVPGSIDEQMAQALVEKQEDSEEVLGEDGSVDQMKFLLDKANEMSETEIIQAMARRMF